jgi:hypothetical protein
MMNKWNAITDKHIPILVRADIYNKSIHRLGYDSMSTIFIIFPWRIIAQIRIPSEMMKEKLKIYEEMDSS